MVLKEHRMIVGGHWGVFDVSGNGRHSQCGLETGSVSTQVDSLWPAQACQGCRVVRQGLSRGCGAGCLRGGREGGRDSWSCGMQFSRKAVQGKGGDGLASKTHGKERGQFPLLLSGQRGPQVLGAGVGNLLEEMGLARHRERLR